MSNDGMSVYSWKIPQWPWGANPPAKKNKTGGSNTPETFKGERVPVVPFSPIKPTVPVKTEKPPVPVQVDLLTQATKVKPKEKGGLKKEDFANDGILPDLFDATKSTKEKVMEKLDKYYREYHKLRYGEYPKEESNTEEQMIEKAKQDAKKKKLESLPIPEYKGDGGLKELLEFNEKLKQRLRDAGETVPDSPFQLPPDKAGGL